MVRRSAAQFFPVVIALCSTGLVAGAANAQGSPTPAAPQTTDPPPATTPQVPVAPPTVPAIPTIDEEMAQAGATYPTRLFAGFGDIDYSSAKNPVTNRQFSLGQLTLQATSALSAKTFGFGELTFTARPDAGTGSPAVTGYNTEVERLFLRYDESDVLKISAGKYHTPINWWNTAFHHGLWLQTTIARPEMARFGGQFIPNHFVGLQLEGGVPAGGLNLYYNAGVGNGRSAVVSRAGDAGDSNDIPAELLNVYFRPDKLFGVEVGGAAYIDNVPVSTTSTTAVLTSTTAAVTSIPATTSFDVHETILAAHLVYQKENPEFIAEYAHIRHSVDGGETNENYAYYVQVAYRRPGGLFKPYYRYEYISVAPTDPVLTETPSLRGNTVGIRYDFTELAALKLEYRNMQRTPTDVAYGASTTGAFAQVSFAF